MRQSVRSRAHTSPCIRQIDRYSPFSGKKMPQKILAYRWVCGELLAAGILV